MNKDAAKSGGNGIVTFAGKIATKTLKQVSKERLDRLEIEVEALRRARGAGISNIVEILDARLDKTPPSYTMRRYDGHLDLVLNETRNNPARLAQLVLPIVRALAQLAALSPAIYHRDLKPENILVSGGPGPRSLHLADFGCAYLAKPGAARITQDHWAVGATFYRAPEFTHGRVQDVTSAGDVFSIGKLLWYLCNGVRREVFPYTLWFPPE